MLAENTPKSVRGSLLTGITPHKSISAVILFIESNIDAFAKQVKGEVGANEKALTDILCKFLNKRVYGHGYPFHFHHENMENRESGISPQIDIGTISNHSDQLLIGDRNYGEFDSFFSIEAKRLPTPGSGRSQEYVIGSDRPSGGIERFKKGIHGKNLDHAAIVAYIQENNDAFWLSEINNWIDELIANGDGTWEEGDKLTSAISRSMSNKYTSRNRRNTTSDYIDLNHYWIDIKA